MTKKLLRGASTNRDRGIIREEELREDNFRVPMIRMNYTLEKTVNRNLDQREEKPILYIWRRREPKSMDTPWRFSAS